jgi:hypothetical protein
VQAVQERRINPVAFLLSDGTCGFTGDEVFPNRESARRAWPAYRRDTWGHARRGTLPAAAGIFDALTTDGFDVVHRSWQADPFPLDQVRRALDGDRAAVRAFQARDPKGARSIADYLHVFVAHLDVVEAEAQRLAAVPRSVPGWQREYPHRLTTGARYGLGLNTVQTEAR